MDIRERIALALKKQSMQGMEHKPFVSPTAGLNGALQAYGNEVLGRIKNPAGALGAAIDRMKSQSPEEMAMDWATPGVGLVGATAWHGSPHLFDKFKSSAIGTGEGAQAYGHGLYLAEAPDVAKQYQMAGVDYSKSRDPVEAAYDAIKYYNGNKDAAIASLKSSKNDFAKAQLEAIQSGAVDNLKPGQMYKTDIPDAHIDKMLDWDKPLSEQHPDVQAAINKIYPNFTEIGAKHKEIGKRLNELQWNGGIDTPEWNALVGEVRAGRESLGIDPNVSGDDFYRHLAEKLGGQQQASAKLSEHGLGGIKYLDGSSRAGGEGTRNFVMFNPDDIRILERNGQATGLKPWDNK